MLNLGGLSTGDFEPALRELLGEEAVGLSASSISRLTEQWRQYYEVSDGGGLTSPLLVPVL